MPSPVESDGLVVTAKHWPAPPVAITVCRASTVCRLPVGSRAIDAGGAAVVHEEIDGEPAFVHLGTRLLDRGDQRALDLGAGRVAAGVHDARDGVTTFAGEGEARRRRRHGRTRAPRSISSRTRSGPRSPARRTASASQSPPPAVIVSEPCSVGRVVVLDQRGGDAALRVPGGRPPDLALGEHADRQAGVPGVDRRGQARDTAAEDEEIGHGRVTTRSSMTELRGDLTHGVHA